MIKSITFDGKSGYITRTIPEPDCPVRGYDPEKKMLSRSKDLTDEEKELLKQYRKEYREWKKHKDDYQKPQLVKNLVGRKIEFEPGKINLIFGPNASGKTTILKAIAGNAGTTDGYAKLVGPADITFKFGEITGEDFRKYLDKMMKNSATVEWDGAPVYYDNFSSRQSYGQFGNMLGSVLGNSIVDEAVWYMNKDRISLGQNSIYLLSRLFDIAMEHKCYADLFGAKINPDGSLRNLHISDVWENAYKIQLDYYLGMEKSFEKSPSTFLFDELDKSLDVKNIAGLYTQALPELVKRSGVQIIIISHSPLVLSDKIRNNSLYNFISMDDEYTKQCLESMTKLF